MKNVKNKDPEFKTFMTTYTENMFENCRAPNYFWEVVCYLGMYTFIPLRSQTYWYAATVFAFWSSSLMGFCVIKEFNMDKKRTQCEQYQKYKKTSEHVLPKGPVQFATAIWAITVVGYIFGY